MAQRVHQQAKQNSDYVSVGLLAHGCNRTKIAGAKLLDVELDILKMVQVRTAWGCAILQIREPEPGPCCSLPDVALKEEAVIAEVGRAAQAASHLPVFLHDLDHLTHGCKRTGERTYHHSPGFSQKQRNSAQDNIYNTLPI